MHIYLVDFQIKYTFAQNYTYNSTHAPTQEIKKDTNPS